MYIAEGLSYIPPTLSSDYIARRLAVRETLIEILVADLGDATTKSPYLIVSSNLDFCFIRPDSISFAVQTMTSPSTNPSNNLRL